MTVTVQNSRVTTFSIKDLDNIEGNPLSHIVREYGVVYVTSITRDGCSGCQEQKPLFRDLASRLSDEHHGKLSFNNIHVKYADGDTRESGQAKRILGHGSYPTYMIHIKSEYGPLEHYRAAYPRMEDLDQQAVNAIELATFYQEQAIKEKD
ncbi:MAG TPA: hypothetical protein VFV92_11770 [Candidatus Bathyarchaeia archaeon]|nr:hypothetical protein [Candidatus Bathyarchaeia archaeon]